MKRYDKLKAPKPVIRIFWVHDYPEDLSAQSIRYLIGHDFILETLDTGKMINYLLQQAKQDSIGQELHDELQQAYENVKIKRALDKRDWDTNQLIGYYNRSL